MTILILISAFPIFSQQSNISIIENYLKNSSKLIVSDLISKKIYEIKVDFTEKEISLLFEQIFFKDCANNDIKILTKSNNTLLLDISSSEIVYQLIDETDLVERKLNFEVYAKFSNGSIVELFDIEKLFLHDTLNYEYLIEIEKSEYKFTKSTHPKQHISFYKRYLQPIIITTSAIITVILFFSIRS